MSNFKLSLIFISAVCIAMFAQACTKVAAIEYSKFNSDADVPRISVEDAKREFDAGTAYIIDARNVESYKSEHIAGSNNIQFGSGAADPYKDLPKDKKLIIYCSCHAEHTSAAMGFDMNQKGIAGTYAMVGGTNAWKSAGYPMQKSE